MVDSTNSAGKVIHVPHKTRLSRVLSALNIFRVPAFIGSVLSVIGSSLRDLIDKHNVAEKDMAVSKFYTFYGSHRRHRAPFYALHGNEPTSTDVFQLVTTCFIGILFGSIHCFGWDFNFPSYAEHMLWKVCSLAISCIPFIWLLFVVFYTWQSKFSVLTAWGRIADGFMALVWASLFPFGLVGEPVYILARLGLLTEAFIELRAVPAGAYEDVQWTLFLPHVQI